MPQYRVTRHEDWIAVLDVEANNRDEALEIAHNAEWSGTDAVFNEADGDSLEIEEALGLNPAEVVE